MQKVDKKTFGKKDFLWFSNESKSLECLIGIRFVSLRQHLGSEIFFPDSFSLLFFHFLKLKTQVAFFTFSFIGRQDGVTAGGS